ncbi:XcyI family restriction endonuclease [Burkholderia sp. Bp8992]|uniref:XcyI family restriction endonuclease n=1 Tax=Burkholderia sp. Bp8992 TaxID=2184554 RepID=UPI000F55AE76|nr:XcyI family restriction endonuclease [Burkholderia sp. Bp8992]RQS27971.1 XcyI family restriction endonuclease [Burkholderia sp. Bp8992]
MTKKAEDSGADTSSISERDSKITFSAPEPDLQIAFAASLREIREHTLQEALRETVRSLSIPDIDNELARFVPKHALAQLASQGLRGEMVFPVPIVLSTTPRLLGYYRLLYGYSQKEFYTSATGYSRLKLMEERGTLSAASAEALPDACSALCDAGALLLTGIGTASVNAALLDDLTLLTLGPQLRGGANVRKGTAGIRTVFNAIHEIVEKSVVNISNTSIEVKNAAGRRVLIEFAADPDIIIREEMRASSFRQLIAIEVKAGSDFSNIHNRVGEAEKSHQKAKASGFAECWTVVNVDKMDLQMARRESPSTNRFYKISDLAKASGDDFQDFHDRIVSLTGIPTALVRQG